MRAAPRPAGPGADDAGAPVAPAPGVPESGRAVRQDPPAGGAAFAAGRRGGGVGGGASVDDSGWETVWRTHNHLDAAQMTEPQWRDRWDAARMFLTADGETGKAGGNETIRVDEAGHLRIKAPAALAEQFGTHLHDRGPVRFRHRGAVG